MSDLIERLRSVRGSFVIPVECPNVFAWAEEAADALEQKDKRIAELEGALYQSYIDNGCRPEEAREYMQMAVGAEDGQMALKDTT
jgi:hypothetical protein